MSLGDFAVATSLHRHDLRIRPRACHELSRSCGTQVKHFLAGTGTEMRFGARSQISQEARTSRAFQDLNRHIQAAAASQLRTGQSRVRLTGPALRTIRFGLPGSSQDLYLGFRGTQGLDIDGTGTMTDVGYSGSLTYVIRDSYGFPPEDQLLGIGTAMRYLQVNCGNPPTRGGARWFPTPSQSP